MTEFYQSVLVATWSKYSFAFLCHAEGAEQEAAVVRSPSGTFELPPEASTQITTLHKEMEEMVRLGGAVGVLWIWRE